MSYNKKHNKIKNTGILFELLTRQITVDVLNNENKEHGIASICIGGGEASSMLVKRVS